MDHVTAHAPRYFRDLERSALKVRLVWSTLRANARLYCLALESPTRTRELVVKVRHPRSTELKEADPELFPGVPDECKLAREHRALIAIEQHLRTLADHRLGGVRVLDCVPQLGALIMEAAPGANLAAGLDVVGRRRKSPLPDSLITGVRNSGRWLSAYQRMPSIPRTASQPNTREAFIASVRELLDGVALDRSRSVETRELGTHLTDRATHLLPSEFPSGMGHGDYHPGNVLADETGRVFVIDTFAAWQGPVYYDISHYLFSLKTPRHWYSALGSRSPFSGFGALDLVENEFLNGYFDGAPIPIAAIRLFEIQHLLYRWSRAAGASRWPGLEGLGKRARLTVKSRFFRDLLARLLRDVNDQAPPTGVQRPPT